MPRRYAVAIALVLFSLTSCSHFNFFQKPSPLRHVHDWFILLDYNEDSLTHRLDWDSYRMAILDADYYPDFKSQIAKDSNEVTFIAYVSFGEAERYRSYWKKIEGASWLLQDNPNWKDNVLVDIRNPHWHRILIEDVIPEVVSKGFHGIFMDTLDTAAWLEDMYPHKYPNAKAAMVDLVREVHEKYPDLILISNNGFDILGDLAPYLGGVLVEDIHGQVDFENDGYKDVSEEDRIYKTQILKQIIKDHRLPIFNIDYASMDDIPKCQAYYAASKKLGYRPYIAEKKLNRLYPQPN